MNAVSMDTRQRIKDMLTLHRMSLRELAKESGIDRDRLGRFLNGAADKLNYTDVAALARAFGVSSDFLLGLTNDFYFGQDTLSRAKVDPAVVSLLLRNKSFVMAMKLIGRYLDEELAVGVAIQNRILDSLTEYIRRRSPDDKALLASLPLMKCPPTLMDEGMISWYFMQAVREIKQSSVSLLEKADAQAKGIAEKCLAELEKRRTPGEDNGSEFGILIEKLMFMYGSIIGEENGREKSSGNLDRAV